MLTSSSVPPNAAARSRIDCIPKWPGRDSVGSKPRPSSAISSSNSVSVDLEPNLDAIGVGVFDDVVHRLAADQDQCFLGRRWDIWLVCE